MAKLFSYTIPIDDGAAPNPFHGMCTLTICKPGIRRAAVAGDWIAGLGAKLSPSGDLSGRLVYAMCVEEVVTLEKYDELAPKRWPHRIPKISSPNLWDRLGDCIYDYSSGKARLRASVHSPRNRKTDLSGKTALISSDFYYFGREALLLPKRLQSICHQTQGHRSHLNDPFVDDFVEWIRGADFKSGCMSGWPDFDIDWGRRLSACGARQKDGECDFEG
jgi:Nucleotide modification associated domain 2